MTFKRAIPRCTPIQQERQDKARAAGCIACRIEGCREPFPREINHMAHYGRQLGQDFTECLEGWHHRGLCLEGYTVEDMQIEFGPSLFHNKRLFELRYGDWRKRLEYQNALIDVKTVAEPSRKRSSLSSKKCVSRKAA